MPDTVNKETFSDANKIFEIEKRVLDILRKENLTVRESEVFLILFIVKLVECIARTTKGDFFVCLAKIVTRVIKINTLEEEELKSHNQPN